MATSFTTTFFHHCAGADLEILHHPDCRTDHSKYVGVGAAVFFTALFAWISASFALYTVFENYWVILIGLVWALFIFSLDRYIVSTIRRGNGWLASLISAGPRLLIAFFLALVVSKPLELRIFNKEISRQLQIKDQADRKTVEDRTRTHNGTIKSQYEKQRARLEKELADLRTKRDDQNLRASNELNGQGGSKAYGNGPAYQRELAVAQRLNQEYAALDGRNTPLIDALNRKLQYLDTRMEADVTQQLKSLPENKGLLAEINALGTLTETGTMKWASLAITILFIVIEIAPVLVKVLTPEGPYDVKLDSIEKKVKAREIEEVSQLNEEVNRNIQIALGENEQAVETQLRGNQALLNQINQAQLEIAQVMIDQWKNGELDKLRGLADSPVVPQLSQKVPRLEATTLS